jgi:3-oxoacyl-[acyl-carrier protein] reductase
VAGEGAPAANNVVNPGPDLNERRKGEGMRLKGKTALVTGAGQGFGFGIAEAFVREGARVACLDLKGDVAEAAAKRFGPSAMAIHADVSSRADVERAAREAVAAFGRIDIVVNNAGTTHRNKPIMDVTEEEFDRIFAVNVKSILLAAQAFVPHMRANGGGVFVNVGSTAALRPRPGLTVYNASKGAVHVMTKSMAVELAPDKIRVCALAPVAGETPLLAMFMGEDTPEKRAAFKATVPLGRFSTPHDIGAAALFLASDEANFLTGVVLEVDGGRCI